MHPPEWIPQPYEERPFWSYLISDARKGHVGLEEFLPPRIDEVDESHISRKVPGNGVIVQDLFEAMRDRSDLVRPYLMTEGVRPEENVFAALHGVFLSGGSFIYVPPGIKVDRTVELRLDVRSSLRSEHTIVVADKDSDVQVEVEACSDENGQAQHYNEVVEIFVREGAKVRFCEVQDQSLKTHCFISKRAIVENDGNIEWVDFSVGGDRVKSDISTVLMGEGAKMSLISAFVGSGTQVIETSTAAIHETKNTSCEMSTKGAVAGSSRSAYRGLIEIKEKATGVTSHQWERTLLLSDDAQADTLPILEIKNNDVKCSHSAGVGQVDAEQLFYIMSRGLTEEDAKRAIVEGFFEPHVQEIASEALRSDLKKRILRRVI